MTHSSRAALLRPLVLITGSVLFLISGLAAQAPTGRLHGQVIDPTGAVIPNAAITLKGESGQTLTSASDGVGTYNVKNLPAGKYTMTVSEKGFRPFADQVEIAPGEDKKLNVTLEVYVKEEHVEVQSDATKVDVNPANNASAVVLTGKDLDALSDDPDELQSELQALAGPSAGPNGGQIYIDGFTGGQLPPKSSIREIRINQNPFSAEYDRMGFGRIEILTKPGTDRYHGQFFVNDNHSVFDARNPFAAEKPDFDSQIYNGNMGGPLSKKSSFFLDMQRRNINEVGVINAQVLDSSLNPVAFTGTVLNPRIRTSISPRLDFQLGAGNTLTVRYRYTKTTEQNNGIGQFALASQGFNESSTEHTVQISDTQVLSPHAVNETRFEYERNSSLQNALNPGPTIDVLGAFVSGGNPLGTSDVGSNHYEIQNYTSYNKGSHFLRFGGRLRATGESNSSTQNFGGTFTFASLEAYQITQQGLQNGLTMAQIQAAGGGPSQFSQTTGQPLISNTIFDVGLYGEDDWRFRPNMTLSYGLRYETQNDIQDHADWAPRIGFAWGLGGNKKNPAPRTVIRTGFGIFYDRVTQNIVLQTERLNGTTQQSFVVKNPLFFPNVPPVSSLTAVPSSQFVLSPELRAPYTIQAAVSLEHQIKKSATATITYIHSRGIHQLVLVDTNAPVNPLDVNSRPQPGLGDIFQYTSEADFKQNQLIGHVNVRAGQKLTLFSFYSLSFANSDTGGANTVATNPNNISADYGRASFDVRSRLFLGGSVGLPRGFRVSPFLLFFTGAPYNITTGTDLNGDSIFNDRPAFDTGIAGHTVVAKPGFPTFDVTPLPGQQLIPVNFGDGPAQFTLNLRLSKAIGIGPKLETADNGPQPAGPQGGGRPHGPHGGPGGGGHRMGGPGGPFGVERSNRRYTLTLSAAARNIFNRVNPGPPTGNLTSPLFGESNSLAGGPFNTQAANRRVDFQMVFAF
ncbi:MAG TPA: carboxypeptidase regulatory-like domain-containing protein [Candidatus Limnocylindrales bacterium]|nr:carboxypeptidase regulatory-like domain-containing protein [Candidatus Limnocylindrales bacterium]